MTTNNDLNNKFQLLQERLEGQLKRKDYELALVTTEELIELCSNVDAFDISRWLNYYSKIKEHMFTKTLDEKREIVKAMIENQEIVRISKFQSQMKLMYIEDFEFVIKSLPDSELYSFQQNRIEFNRPQSSTIDEAVNSFLSDLHMIIQ